MVRMSARLALLALGTGFAVYFWIRSVWWVQPPHMPVLVVLCSTVTLIITFGCLFTRPREAWKGPQHALTVGNQGPSVLPWWAATCAAVLAGLTPFATARAAGSGHETDSFATVYLGSVGLVLAVVAIRRRAVHAIVGLIVLSVASMIVLGPVTALAQGLTGTFIWVIASVTLLAALDNLGHAGMEQVERQNAAVAQQEAVNARRRERRERVRYALQVAAPTFESVIEQRGSLSEEQRRMARAAEAALRDELRGGALLDARVRDVMYNARARGINLTFFDEGGVDTLSPEQLARVRTELASIVLVADSPRIIIRTAQHPEVAVTVVGRSGLSDGEDDVDVWHEIKRHVPLSDAEREEPGR